MSIPSGNEENLYKYWKSVPTIKEIKDSKTREVMLQPVRDAILELLRVGVKDSFGIRHLLTAQDLHSLIEKKFKEKKTIQNIYHHLNVLTKFGFIDNILEIKKDGHVIKYFGRLAKLFIFTNPKSDFYKEKRKKFIFDLVNLMIKINGTETDGEELYNKILERELDLHHRLSNWLEENDELITSSDIEVRDLHGFLWSISTVEEKYSDIYREILNGLKFL